MSNGSHHIPKPQAIKPVRAPARKKRPVRKTLR